MTQAVISVTEQKAKMYKLLLCSKLVFLTHFKNKHSIPAPTVSPYINYHLINMN
jgi:hypothetical protein